MDVRLWDGWADGAHWFHIWRVKPRNWGLAPTLPATRVMRDAVLVPSSTRLWPPAHPVCSTRPRLVRWQAGLIPGGYQGPPASHHVGFGTSWGGTFLERHKHLLACIGSCPLCAWLGFAPAPELLPEPERCPVSGQATGKREKKKQRESRRRFTRGPGGRYWGSGAHPVMLSDAFRAISDSYQPARARQILSHLLSAAVHSLDPLCHPSDWTRARTPRFSEGLRKPT